MAAGLSDGAQPGSALAFSLGGGLFLAVPIGLLHSGFDWVSLVGCLVFGLIVRFCLMIAVNLWFYRSVVDISSRGLMVRGGIFGCGPRRWIDAAEIDKIETPSNLQSEKLMYCDLIIVCRGGSGSPSANGCRVAALRLPLAG